MFYFLLVPISSRPLNVQQYFDADIPEYLVRILIVFAAFKLSHSCFFHLYPDSPIALLPLTRDFHKLLNLLIIVPLYHKFAFFLFFKNVFPFQLLCIFKCVTLPPIEFLPQNLFKLSLLSFHIT